MSIRTERLAAVIQRDLGQIMQKGYQASSSFITITNVVVSKDLMNANVYISIYAPAQDEQVIYENLESNIDSIRKELASKIRHQVRRIPELNFNRDESAEYAQKMEKLFTEIREERQQRHSNEE